jgi:hypothetical protein
MRCAIVVIENELCALYTSHNGGLRDEEGQVLELKAALQDNPESIDNLEYWLKQEEHGKIYSFVVFLDYDRNETSFLPFGTEKDEKEFYTTLECTAASNGYAVFSKRRQRMCHQQR